MDYIIRNARKEEARELAMLVNHAGKSPGVQGLDLYGWSLDAKEGEVAYDVGARNITAESGTYSYKNMRVIEVQGKIAALAMSFEAFEKTEAEMEDVPEVFRIFKHLTNTIPGCYYLDSLAASPEFRGMGLGRKMLEDTINVGKNRGYDALYLLVFDENKLALSLYEKIGFSPVRELLVPDHSEMPFGGNIVLMKKGL